MVAVAPAVSVTGAPANVAESAGAVSLGLTVQGGRYVGDPVIRWSVPRGSGRAVGFGATNGLYAITNILEADSPETVVVRAIAIVQEGGQRAPPDAWLSFDRYFAGSEVEHGGRFWRASAGVSLLGAEPGVSARWVEIFDWAAGAGEATFTVTASTAPPTVRIDTADTTIDQGQALQLRATTRDPFGVVVAHAWTASAPGDALVGGFADAAQRDAVWTGPEATADTLYALTLTATDDDGRSASATVFVTVRATPPARAALAGGLAGTIAATAALGQAPPLDARATLAGELAGTIAATAALGQAPPLDARATLAGELAGTIAATAALGQAPPLDARATLAGELAGTIAATAALGQAPPLDARATLAGELAGTIAATAELPSPDLLGDAALAGELAGTIAATAALGPRPGRATLAGELAGTIAATAALGQAPPLAPGRATLAGELAGTIAATAALGPRPGRATLAGELAGTIAATAALGQAPPLAPGRATLAGGLAGRIAARAELGAPPALAPGRATLAGGLAGDLTATAALGENPASRYAEALRSLAPRDTLLSALEVRHPELDEPILAVNDTAAHDIEGRTYRPARFEARLADDVEGRPPRAQIVLDGTDRALRRALDREDGGQGATVRLIQFLAGSGLVSWETTLDVMGLQITGRRIPIDLGYDPGLDGPAVLERYDPDTNPGLF